MTAAAPATVARASRARPASLRALARLEARRFALNPVFLAGAACTAYILWDRQRGVVADVNTVTAYPAIFLGGVGMVAAFWLTQSMRRSADALDVAPMSWPTRTGAICLAAAIPPLCGGLSLLAIEAFQRVPGPGATGPSGHRAGSRPRSARSWCPRSAARCWGWPWPGGSRSREPPPCCSWWPGAG